MMYRSDYKLFETSQEVPHNIHSVAPESATSNPRQFIENVLGNWVPNTNGTYSPFGETAPRQSLVNIFEKPIECEGFTKHKSPPIIFDEIKTKPLENQDSVNFKPSAVVQPMRPSYSDVLAKSAPTVTNKAGKTDVREAKQKKENGKKPTKSDKSQKSASSRLTNGNEAKNDKNSQNHKANDKASKETKHASKMSCKWASFDNLDESVEDESKKNKKNDDSNGSKGFAKVTQVKVGKGSNDFEENDSSSSRNDTFNITKTTNRKGPKITPKQRNSDGFGSADKPPGRRGQRFKKKENHVPFGNYQLILKHCIIYFITNIYNNYTITTLQESTVML